MLGMNSSPPLIGNLVMGPINPDPIGLIPYYKKIMGV